MIHLTRTYYLHLHVKLSPDDMTLVIMSIVYENLSLRELDNSIELTLDDLTHRGFIITMADVEVENQQHTHLPNINFSSLKDIPGPVTSGVLKPKGEQNG